MENRGFEEKVAVYISENRLFDIGSRVLVTVSGGADSVALLCLLNGLGYDCVAAHCNFHLRGEESMRDERFVRALCGKLGVECVVRDFDVPAYMAEHKVSMEMACRELRYGWFEEVRESSGCAVIAVAHHSDDSVETFFLNMLRGCGIAGLAGIKPVNGRVVRPFLCVSRADIEEYLQEIRQDYIVDSTNHESEYSRNKVRNIILPVIRQCFPEADAALRRTLSNVAGGYAVFNDAIQRIRQDICTQDGDRLVIDRQKLEATAHPLTVLHEILSPYGFNGQQEKDMLATTTVGAVFRSGRFVAEAGRGVITLFEGNGRDDEAYEFRIDDVSRLPLRLKVEKSAYYPGFRFIGNKNTAYFDGSIAEETLTLRHWREGDRFRPFGMHGSKKLSDYFNDNKFSLADKRSVWLLCCGDRILWVVGHRAAADFMVTDTTKEIIAITVEK